MGMAFVAGVAAEAAAFAGCMTLQGGPPHAWPLVVCEVPLTGSVRKSFEVEGIGDYNIEALSKYLMMLGLDSSENAVNTVHICLVDGQSSKLESIVQKTAGLGSW